MNDHPNQTDVGQALAAVARAQKLMLDVRNGTTLMTPELATQTLLVLEDAMVALKRLGESRS